MHSIFAQNIVVVVGHKAELVKEEIDRYFKVLYAFQKQLLGTGDAVRTAIPLLSDNVKHVLVLCGDVPLIKKETIKNFVNYHISNHHDISVLGVTVESPTDMEDLYLMIKNNLYLSVKRQMQPLNKK